MASMQQNTFLHHCKFRFSLPKTADDAKITARYTHGILEIRIPKKEAATEKKIKISVDE